MHLEGLQALVAEGESERLEFKKSTGDLKGGLETLCAFLNGDGGRVLFGVSTAGVIRGQDVSDNTLRELGNELVRLEPPAHIVLTRVPVIDSREEQAANRKDRVSFAVSLGRDRRQQAFRGVSFLFMSPRREMDSGRGSSGDESNQSALV
jgi:predicted HTH transcriptional regulator